MDRDVFICHASEDKKGVVRPLISAFEKAGISCWVDEGEINWGDSITQKVNEGLGISRFVIVVLSESFPGKNWPERELYAVLNLEAASGEVKVLPLLVGDRAVRANILRQYPILNDKRYLTWENDPSPLVEAALKLLSRTANFSSSSEQTRAHIKSNDEIPLPRIRKRFSERDKDLFLKETFTTIKDYFQRALTRLENKYAEVDTDFAEVHKYKYIAKIYLTGDVKSQCKIWVGGLSSSDGIAYSEGRFNMDQDNSYNEIITINDDGYKLHLRFSLGIMYQRQVNKDCTPLEAAELLWSRFVAPLEHH